MYVDGDFRNYVENIRKNFLEQNGIEVSYAKITKLAAEKLREFDFENDTKSVLINGKRKRRIIFDLD